MNQDAPKEQTQPAPKPTSAAITEEVIPPAPKIVQNRVEKNGPGTTVPLWRHQAGSPCVDEFGPSLILLRRLPLKPFRNLAQTTTPDGSRFSLHEHDGDYFLKLNGLQLMSTTSTSSELELAEIPCRRLRGHAGSNVLIGGLGLGFSLQRVLEIVGPGATVHVAELLPEVVQWNKEFLHEVNGRLLEDKRVKVIIQDVHEVIRLAPKPFYDVILLDVDNGPTSFVQSKNRRLYKWQGLDLIARTLRPGGKVAFWSAVVERDFEESLKRAGYQVEAHPAKAHDRAKRFAHMIYVAEPWQAEKKE